MNIFGVMLALAGAAIVQVLIIPSLFLSSSFVGECLESIDVNIRFYM